MSIPDIPDRFAWAWEEEPVSSHIADFAGKFRYGSAFYFLAVLAFGLSFIGFFVPAREGAVVAYTIGTISILSCIALLAWGIRVSNSIVSLVDIYPSGILWLHNGKWGGGRWEEIKDVFRAEVYVNGSLQTQCISLTTRGSKKVDLHYPLGKWKKMADAILSETTIRLLPEALNRFYAGETIRFGDTSINQDELIVEKKKYPFDEMKKINISNGTIVVTMKGKKGNMAYLGFSAIPNYLVFLKLLDVSDAPKPNLSK